jgi:hypothetical protein
MADKNVKAELNAENLEGVAGGAAVEIRDIDKHSKEYVDIRAGIENSDMHDPWRDKDLHSEKRPPENKDEEPRHDVEF